MTNGSRTTAAPKQGTAKKPSGQRSRKPGTSRMPRAERQQQVLTLAKQSPGISVSEAAKQLNLKESSLHTLASLMRREKLFAPSKSGSGLRPAVGRSWRCRAFNTIYTWRCKSGVRVMRYRWLSGE